MLLSFPALLFWLPGWAGLFQLDRGAMARGEVWRIVTCHWTHWTASHLVWDLAAFVLLGALCETWGPQGRRALFSAVAASALLIPLVLWVALPDIETYRGLSGIDSALFVLAAILVLRRELESTGTLRSGPALAAGVALAAFLAKTGYELVNGTVIFADSEDGFISVPLAHLVGGVCGLCAGSFTGACRVSRYRKEWHPSHSQQLPFLNQ